MIQEPLIVRVRHEVKRRQLTVLRVETIAASMVRIVLGGTDLEGFTTLGFDDHLKLFFPPASRRGNAQNSWSTLDPASFDTRDFTPRHFDPKSCELSIDFFLHGAGPAALWAGNACVGDPIMVGGPRGSAQISCEGISLHLLIGDETAAPAIGRRLEELPAGAKTLVLLEGEPLSTWPAFKTRALPELVFLQRRNLGSQPEKQIVDQLRAVDFATSGCFAWVAHESHTARAIRRYLREERRMEKQWIKAAAYWRRGDIGIHDRIEDDV